MKITQLTLYSINIDKDNEIVINPITSNPLYQRVAYYSSILNELCNDSKTIYLNSFRGVYLDIEKNTSITLDEITIDEIQRKGFNYIALQEGSSTSYFGFIDRMEDIGSSSIRLYLKYDVWGNNIEKIMKLNYEITNEISVIKNSYGTTLKAHFNSYKQSDDDLLTPLTYRLDTPKPINFVSNISAIDEKIFEGKGYKLLFAKILTTDRLKVVNKQDKDKVYKIPTPTASLPIYYCPLGLYNIDDNIYVPCFVTGETPLYLGVTPVNVKYPLFTINGIPNLEELFQDNPFFNEIAPYIISMNLTFNAPLDYEIDRDNKNNLCVNFNKSTTNIMPIEEWGYSLISTSTALCAVFPTAFSSLIDTDITLDNGTTKISQITSVNNLSEKSTFNTTHRLFFSDGIFRQFPFNYKTIECGDNKKIIEPLSSNYQNFYIEYKLDTDILKYRLIYKDEKNNDRITDYRYYRGEWKNQLSFSIESLQYFLTTQGASAKTSVGINMINNILSGAKTVASFVTGVPNFSTPHYRGTLLSYKATLTDAENSPNAFKLDLNRGESNFDYLDLLMLVNYNSDLYQPEIMEFENNIYTFGYEYNTLRNCFDTTKYYFDYTQMYDVHIGDNFDGYDKELLTNLFKRGFTRAHIRENYRQANSTNYIINKSLNNVDSWLGKEFFE